MSKAWIEGREVRPEEAIAAAAAALSASRMPLLTGLASDVAGIRAAARLAEAVGSVIDHERSEALFGMLSVLRDTGMILGSPAEIRRRADRILVVGAEAFRDWPGLPDFLFSRPRDLGASPGEERSLVWLGAPSSPPAFPAGVSVEAIACPAERLVEALGLLRAAVGGRRFGEGAIPIATVRRLADWLAGAGFGCLIWPVADTASLLAEMAAGLVSDLNAATRFAALPVHGPGQAFGAAQVLAFATGLPMRTGFARSYPEHDPLLFETRRLIASGETDLVLYLSALAGFEAGEPDWSGHVATIALVPPGTRWRAPPRILIETAPAGRGPASVLFRAELASFAPADGVAADGLPASAILAAIEAALRTPAADRAA